MAKEIVKEEIDGVIYQFAQLAPTVALKLLTRLIKLVGGPMAAMSEPSMADLGSIVSKLGENLDSDQVIDTIKMALSQTFPLGSTTLAPLSEQFDAHFINHGTFHMFKVLKKALEVQYGDFFGENGVIGFTKAQKLG